MYVCKLSLSKPVLYDLVYQSLIKRFQKKIWKNHGIISHSVSNKSQSITMNADNLADTLQICAPTTSAWNSTVQTWHDIHTKFDKNTSNIRKIIQASCCGGFNSFLFRSGIPSSGFYFTSYIAWNRRLIYIAEYYCKYNSITRIITYINVKILNA